MLIDSHCHLNLLALENYQNDLGKLIDAAKIAGVEKILCVGVDLVHAKTVLAIADKFLDVFASVGLHPTEKATRPVTVEELIALAAHPKVIAIGETGLDYYRQPTDIAAMGERFRCHIRAALAVKKPLIVHSRSAQADTIRILTEEKAQQVSGVMHCFTESWEMAQQAMALGFYISFSGIITFKNAKNVMAVAKAVPLTHLLIETDAPYLAPEPFRGQPNEPQYLPLIAAQLAQLKNLPLATIAQHTTENFNRLFKVSS